MESILNAVNTSYPVCAERLELLRDSGSLAYAVYSGEKKYFLRVVKPSLAEAAIVGADVQVFLQRKGFPVPRIFFTGENRPYCRQGDRLLILYEYIEGEDSDPKRDIERIGALVGRLHQEMREYPGMLITRDKNFFIGRYLEILRTKKYPRAEEYAAYGDGLWEQLKDLPMGYCHGDMYCGNIRKGTDGALYLHDFDTSCWGIPMYDAALICDCTEYFQYEEGNLRRSDQMLRRFLPEYEKFCRFTIPEKEAFHPLIALQHFSTQATIVELFGPNCLSDADIDAQLEWLFRWRAQCREA